MTARDLSKLKPGDMLQIKKGFAGYGKHATYVGEKKDPPYLQVLLPGKLEPVMRHHYMFSVRTPVPEASHDTIS